ncbi:uracil-DNA glycosylase [Comamonadaceae bacterium G21597-S1]|nr:uracil-DNA glycosylase [Comamonadaceae bacterium G21597-S1]
MDWLEAGLAAWDPCAWPVAPDWRETVDAFIAGAVGRRLGEAIKARLAAGATIYPPEPLRALRLTPLHQVRVVILGQDPYHGPGQAHGLAFSVANGVPAPPSLRNIQAEIAQERRAGELAPGSVSLGIEPEVDLTHWTQQGVLLLNTCLTVERGRPGAHARMGWEVLTGEIIAAIRRRPDPVVFMLWGKHAQDCLEQADGGGDDGPRLYLRSNHPSPLSARRPPVPFLGCGHFARTNDFLQRHGVPPVDW